MGCIFIRNRGDTNNLIGILENFEEINPLNLLTGLIYQLF